MHGSTKFYKAAMASKPLVYIAAPLFSQAERKFNSELRKYLSSYFRVFLPQASCDLMPDLIKRGVPIKTAVRSVFSQDLEGVRRCRAIVVVLDGRSIDEGGAFELGLAYAFGKICVGLQTDVRRLAPFGNNPMIDGALEKITSSPRELRDWLRHRFAVRDEEEK